MLAKMFSQSHGDIRLVVTRCCADNKGRCPKEAIKSRLQLKSGGRPGTIGPFLNDKEENLDGIPLCPTGSTLFAWISMLSPGFDRLRPAVGLQVYNPIVRSFQ
jgi:hypothetical protein